MIHLHRSAFHSSWHLNHFLRFLPPTPLARFPFFPSPKLHLCFSWCSWVPAVRSRLFFNSIRRTHSLTSRFKSYLSRHERSHLSTKPFRCPICPKAYYYDVGLKRQRSMKMKRLIERLINLALDCLYSRPLFFIITISSNNRTTWEVGLSLVLALSLTILWAACTSKFGDWAKNGQKICDVKRMSLFRMEQRGSRKGGKFELKGRETEQGWVKREEEKQSFHFPCPSFFRGTL